MKARYCMPNNKFQILSREWFELAIRDLDTAEREEKNGGWSNIIVFHCQQAAEKYLKGFIVLNGLDIKDEFKTHDLIRLLNYSLKFKPALKDLENGCHILTDYYIESRYPLDAPKDYSEVKVKQAIEFVKDIKNKVL